MKFLCIPCDEPMKLAETSGPDEGSVSLTYSCPACGYEMAMLTNPHETQVVGSLGVKLGASGDSPSTGSGQPSQSSGCPFTGMVQEMTAPAAGPDEIPWTSGAQQRLAAIPEFVRPLARSGVERFARDKGYAEITESVLEEARATFGM